LKIQSHTVLLKLWVGHIAHAVEGRNEYKILIRKLRKEGSRCGWEDNIKTYFKDGMMEKISWTNHVRNKEVLLRVKEQRNILHEISKRKANWIGHILRRNCLLRRVIEGKIKGGIVVTGR